MRLQYGAPRERLAAEGAPEGPLAGVHPAVVLHVVAQLERLAAELALERPVAGVHGQVGDQRADVRERLAAELAEDDAVAWQVKVHRGRGRRLVGRIGGFVGRRGHLGGFEAGFESARSRVRVGSGSGQVKFESVRVAGLSSGSTSNKIESSSCNGKSKSS